MREEVAKHDVRRRPRPEGVGAAQDDPLGEAASGFSERRRAQVFARKMHPRTETPVERPQCVAPPAGEFENPERPRRAFEFARNFGNENAVG